MALSRFPGIPIAVTNMMVNGTASYKRYGYKLRKPVYIDTDYVWWVDVDRNKPKPRDTVDIWRRNSLGEAENTAGVKL